MKEKRDNIFIKNNFLIFENKSLYCNKCGGKLFSEPSLDFPDFIKEFYCINCGLRYWVDIREIEKLKKAKESGFIPIINNLS